MRDGDLSMKGCKLAKDETGEGTEFIKTGGVEADMKSTTYKRPGKLTPKIQSRPSQPSVMERTIEDTHLVERQVKRQTNPRNTPGKTEDRECLRCG